MCLGIPGKVVATFREHDVLMGKEAYFRLLATTWKSLMEMYYPNLAWLGLRKDVFDRLNAYRSREGLASWKQTLDALLAMDKESATS